MPAKLPRTIILFLRLFWGEKKWVERLFHENWAVRENAIRNLDRLGFDWQENRELKNQIPYYIDCLKNGDDRYRRRVAAEILGRTGNSRATEALCLASKDDSYSVRASAILALNRIDPALSLKKAQQRIPDFIAVLKNSKEPMRVRLEAARILEVVGDWRALKALLRMADQFLPVGFFLRIKVKRIAKRMKEGNTPFATAYPNILCNRCCRRAVPKRTTGTGGSVWDVVYCPSCFGMMDFLTDVTHVDGHIGGDVLEMKKDKNILTIPLWNEQEKTARNADIDCLIIRAGGVENYHLAVNSVILELFSDASKPKSGLKKIPVYKEETVVLPRDVTHLLKDRFNWVTVKKRKAVKAGSFETWQMRQLAVFAFILLIVCLLCPMCDYLVN